MPKVQVEQNLKSTHWINIKEIAKAIGCPIFELLDFVSKEYDDMKICINKENVRVIFPNKEFFIQETVFDFIKQRSREKKYDLTYWNQ